ncbi:FMN-linked oxidoreductase [Byssothecium circinans]|uniref:FMN-linked oxidoreductase n=1 Tax=Byssothecium circinans TaxID=147558 RepID=A0A6A5TH24_9PLEO|nr:FMN-linked oxidoreductase [Byssothecium circinans]
MAPQTAQNRFLKGAMTERLSSWDPKNLEARGVPSKNLINNFKELASQARKHGSLIVGQVSHPGRQVSDKIQAHPISASDVHLEGSFLGLTFAKPRAATQEDIKDIIEGFAHAAEYLDKAGYDGIQLHGAHGYLLAQFLSPTTNRRTDKYGGSLENRARLILEVAQEVRRRTSKNFILGIKLNSVEFQEKGFDTNDAAALCKLLEDNTFDFVELSGGTYEKLAFEHQRESTKKREAFIEFAEKITPALSKTKAYVTGGFRYAAAMVDALSTVDGVGLARPICLEHELPMQIIKREVHAAINQLTGNNDFGVTNVTAGTQIRQLGKDHQPIDLSVKENFEAFQKDMQKWMKALGEDKEGKKYGYVDIESVQAVPYGRAAPAL